MGQRLGLLRKDEMVQGKMIQSKSEVGLLLHREGGLPWLYNLISYLFSLFVCPRAKFSGRAAGTSANLGAPGHGNGQSCRWIKSSRIASWDKNHIIFSFYVVSSLNPAAPALKFGPGPALAKAEPCGIDALPADALLLPCTKPGAPWHPWGWFWAPNPAPLLMKVFQEIFWGA